MKTPLRAEGNNSDQRRHGLSVAVQTHLIHLAVGSILWRESGSANR